MGCNTNVLMAWKTGTRVVSRNNYINSLVCKHFPLKCAFYSYGKDALGPVLRRVWW